MQTKATLNFITSQARAAMNIITQHSASLPTKSLWEMLSQRAVKSTEDKLEFGDGSVLRYDAQTSGFLAT